MQAIERRIELGDLLFFKRKAVFFCFQYIRCSDTWTCRAGPGGGPSIHLAGKGLFLLTSHLTDPIPGTRLLALNFIRDKIFRLFYAQKMFRDVPQILSIGFLARPF